MAENPEKNKPTNKPDKKNVILANYNKLARLLKEHANYMGHETEDIGENISKKLLEETDEAQIKPEKEKTEISGDKPIYLRESKTNELDMKTVHGAEKECSKKVQLQKTEKKQAEELLSRKNFMETVNYIAKKFNVPAEMLLATTYMEVKGLFSADLYGDNGRALGLGQFHIPVWQYAKFDERFLETLKPFLNYEKFIDEHKNYSNSELYKKITQDLSLYNDLNFSQALHKRIFEGRLPKNSMDLKSYRKKMNEKLFEKFEKGLPEPLEKEIKEHLLKNCFLSSIKRGQFIIADLSAMAILLKYPRLKREKRQKPSNKIKYFRSRFYYHHPRLFKYFYSGKSDQKYRLALKWYRKEKDEYFKFAEIALHLKRKLK